MKSLHKYHLPILIRGETYYPYNVTFENPAMTITKAEIEDWIVEDDKDVTASVTE